MRAAILSILLALTIVLVGVTAFWIWRGREPAPLIHATLAAASTANEKDHVLLVGNSLTSANDLPGCIAALAPSLALSSVTVPNETLTGHLESETVRDALAGGRYRYVVLQEQSVRPLLGRASFRDAPSTSTVLRGIQARRRAFACFWELSVYGFVPGGTPTAKAVRLSTPVPWSWRISANRWSAVKATASSSAT